MPTFVTLIDIRPDHQAEAIQNVRERYEEAVALVESQGGEVKGTYYGDIAGYDALVVSEFPDRASLERANALYSMDPSVETEVTQVHTQAAYADIVDEALSEHEG
ncbi:GYD domain-containing protein [Halosegnis sp.]|uniref:GYD domain-containing protein n=1 Tax=Halosegnis sp. TaxID=2864959 RepID=UPI0035D4258D